MKLLWLTCLFAVAGLYLDAQVTLSGKILDPNTNSPIAYANVILKSTPDSLFISGTITDEQGLFVMSGLKSGKYFLEASFIGFDLLTHEVLIGSLSPFLDIGALTMIQSGELLDEVIVNAQRDEISSKMEKKTYNLDENVSQAGGSVLQMMSNLPSVTVSQDGKVELRGSNKVAVLIDGKQTALTGFDSQKGLDNIPASAIEKIEIINNPSSKYDANGNAGIINIIFKKETKEGLNGQVGLSAGLGALWEKRENLPTIRPQFQGTPKVNPSLSLNYRKKKMNAFFQGDWLYKPTLYKNEFATREYDNGDVITQQVKRNRTTTYSTVQSGVDYYFDDKNTLTLSGLFNREKIKDEGDNPYFLNGLTNRYRLWQFLEDEVKYTASANASFVHKFDQPGHSLRVNGSYYFHREDEKYFFTNILPDFTGTDSFKLLSDEHVADFTADYVKPLSHGRIETGFKFRRRSIPVNMQFFAGENSPLDVNAGGWADYFETIPALYANYVYESDKMEVEGGVRMEYVKVDYEVNPDHNTYKSDGYDYTQPFPSLRIAYKLNPSNKISFFYNRRVDRPNEVDIRIFPKYDEPELIKVGNPTLRPQFTNSLELGYKTIFERGSFYVSTYHRIVDGTITRIATQVPGSVLLYNIFQNAEGSKSTGMELIFQQKLSNMLSYTASANIYRNTVDAFAVTNQYPVPTLYTADEQKITSGNVKLNTTWKLPHGIEGQLSTVYLAPDIIPQGKVFSRFSIDAGVKMPLDQGKGEIFINTTDILNTLRLERELKGDGFLLKSTDYYETQVIRAGYTRKF